MLYLLKNINTGTVFYLVNKTEFTVGRRDCEILIENDPSISRKHARLLIKRDHVVLEDLKSKYKTTHGGKEILPNTEIRLENYDKIHFGVMTSQFIFEQHKLVTTGTRLNSTTKAKLKQNVAALGACFIDQWTSDCTHLTVEEITLTVKVLQAIIDEKPIVLPSYWTKFSKCVQINLPPPNIEDYNNPPISKDLLNKVEINTNLDRKGLFVGKLFIFSKEINKQQMEDVIKKLGGDAISLEKDPLPMEDILKSPKEILVIQTPDKSEDCLLNDIIKLLSKKNKRTIPLQEIAMAIIHASCEKDCNPNFNRAAEVFKIVGVREPTQNNALVQNTESEQFHLEVYKTTVDVKNAGKNVIPETLENNWIIPPFKMEQNEVEDVVQSKLLEGTVEKENSIMSSKRIRIEQKNEKASKKIKMDKEKTSVSGSWKETQSKDQNEESITKSSVSEKRKAEDDVNTTTAKKGNKLNPFVAIMKKSRREPDPQPEATSKKINPFSQLMKSNENISQVSDENPFKRPPVPLPSRKIESVNIQRDISMSTSRKVQDRSPEKPQNYSRISKTGSDLNCTWFSKKSSFEIRDESHYDTEMQSFIDSFKNKIVVEVMASISIRPTITRERVDGVVSSGVSNFKKFKKILPLHPQNRIICIKNLAAVAPGSTAGINDTRMNLQHDTDDDQSNVGKKRFPKKFFI